jgi:general secretion pathway protein J
MTNKKGFTLVEILIALAIFAIIATLTSSIMYYAFSTRARVTEHADRMVSLQLAISLMERDTEQAVERGIRSNDMRLFPPFTGQQKQVEFTRNGMANPRSMEKRSTLTRVALICQGNQLVRRGWESLDPVNRNKYEEKILLTNLVKCQFNYLNQNLQVLPEWHENAMSLNQKSETLPRAIQLILTLKDWGNCNFLFPLPKAMYANIQL